MQKRGQATGPASKCHALRLRLSRGGGDFGWGAAAKELKVMRPSNWTGGLDGRDEQCAT